MKGQAKINENDIWETYRAELVKGAYEKLLAPPPMKDYVVNSSRLNHGKSYIAYTPKTDSREVTLQFVIKGEDEDDYISKYKLFVNTLQAGEIRLEVAKLKTIYKLVYIKCSSYGDYGLKMGKFTVSFIEPSINDRESL